MSTRDGETFDWTAEQRQIITAPAEARLLVDAGPGTGKTATACARIAWLLTDGGVEASDIWLVSFTRTAVHELRNRIAGYLTDPGTVAAIKIATIDAHAWAIHSGFDGQASLSGSFDDNITRVTELVRGHEGVFEYLASVRHLVIDEAQDIVGPRCELLLEVIHALPRSAGVSVFSDEAQSIYGFAEDGNSSNVSGTLPEKIREFLGDQFDAYDLSEVHRTKDKTLLSVFSNGRRLVRDHRLDGKEKLQRVRGLVEKSNHGEIGMFGKDVQALPEDQVDRLLLFRRRGEALAATSYFGERPHRLRMSGLPTCIQGWIAELLWDWVKTDLDQSEFETLWTQRIGSASNPEAEVAWARIVKVAGRSGARVSMTRLVSKLASGSPPYELVLPEFGTDGPIFSTIHGSKGREANEVRLYLPGGDAWGDAEGQDLDEEARIVFVGATRAKSQLHIGQAHSKTSARRLDPSGRAFTPYPYSKGAVRARAQVEVGRANDIDCVGLVGRELYGNAVEAKAAQERVRALKAVMTSVHADLSDEEHKWRYAVSNDGNEGNLCYLNTSLNHDLFGIAKEVRRLTNLPKTLPPKALPHLRIYGIRTLAIAPDDPIREKLHAPWRDSGLVAAPMLIGYPMAYFR